MARKHSPEEIVRKLREGERLIAEGKSITEVVKALGVSDQTYSRWRNQLGGLKADDAKELRRLKDENAPAEADGRRARHRHRDPQGGCPGTLLSPARRRIFVAHAMNKVGVSERQACRAIGHHRSTHRHRPKPAPAPEEQLRQRLRGISEAHPRWGYRMVHGRLKLEGLTVNRKRVQRLWRDEGLRVPQRQPKRLRVGDSTVPAKRLRAEYPNHVWAMDFLFDSTFDGARPERLPLAIALENIRSNNLRRCRVSI